MRNTLDNAKKEHRVSDWHGTPVGKHGCHYSALCISYAECTFGRGGASDEGHGNVIGEVKISVKILVKIEDILYLCIG